MKIISLTRDTLLADNAVLASNLLSRIIGLLGRKELKPKEALILTPCNSVHTFFMRFSIDVIFLDKDNKIIASISRLRPFRISKIYFRGHTVIELPSGTLEAVRVEPGDFLRIS